jgi:hypothetical protein
MPSYFRKLVKIARYPRYVLFKGFKRLVPDSMVHEMHKEADWIFYQGRFDELAKFCESAVALFPDDARLHSMYAIALADTDPDKAAEMAKRAISLSGSL